MTFIQRIRQVVRDNEVAEPFRSSDFDFLSRSPSFLSKHAVGNGRYTEYFVRDSRGLYILLE